MEKWKNIPLTKEEEEGGTATIEDVNDEEIFQRILGGKLLAENSFNSRVFTNTMVGAWRLKNPLETQ